MQECPILIAGYSTISPYFFQDSIKQMRLKPANMNFQLFMSMGISQTFKSLFLKLAMSFGKLGTSKLSNLYADRLNCINNLICTMFKI